MAEADPGADPGADAGAQRGDDAPPERVDPRFTLANERTLLAWVRTALAFVAAGLAVIQLLDRLAFPGGRRIAGVALIALGATMAVAAGWQWRQREDDLHRGRELAGSWLPWMVCGSVVAAALVAVVVVLAGTAAR